MNCPGCNQEIDPHVDHCPACGVPLAEASPATGDPFTTVSFGPRISGAKRVAFTVGALLCLAAVVFTNFIVTIRTYRTLTAESIGYWIGRCLVNFLFPAIVALIYYKLRRLKRANAYKILVLSMWAVLLAIISAAGSLKENPILQERQMYARIGVLAKEASGQIPTSPDTEPWETAARGFFKDVIQFNKDYRNELAALDHDALKENLKPDSFRNHEEMERVKNQLGAALAVDEKYSSLAPLIQKMKGSVEAAGIPTKETDAIINSVESSTEDNLAARQHLFQTDRDWMHAAIDVYEFTLLHESQFVLRESKLIFVSGDLSREFNARMKKATGLRAAFQNERKSFQRMQQEKLAEFGLQSSDFVSAGDNSSESKKQESTH